MLKYNAPTIILCDYVFFSIIWLGGLLYYTDARSVYNNLCQISRKDYAIYFALNVSTAVGMAIYMDLIKNNPVAAVESVNTGFITIFLLIGGMTFLGEAIKISQILGIICIILGVYLI